MGVILQGILGGFSGKVGPVVGGKWKDIDYMRGYVIPANPNTAGQQAVRTKFAQLVATARLLLAGILQPYWDPFHTNMSGFNAWISENYAPSSSTGVLDSSAVMAKGTLTPQLIDSATYATPNVSIDWTENETGNALATDFCQGVIYDISDGSVYISGTSGVRGDDGISMNVGAGKTATNLMCFLFCFRGTGSELVVSDSDGVIAGT